MNVFYELRKRAYYDMYFRCNEVGNIFWTNGFKKFPKKIYSHFLSFINKDGNIIDLGCGNGLLLFFLMKNSKFKIIPYGIDFQEESINQARKIILPDFSSNFCLGNIVNLDFPSNFFDFALLDPYHIKDEEREITIVKIISKLKLKARLIVYSYYDSMFNLKHSRISDFKGMNGFNLLYEKRVKEKIFIACIDKN